MKLEEKILNSFIKYMGKEVKDLDLIVCLTPDCWPEYDTNLYTCEIMETETNGKVWTCECTRNGNVKDVYEI